MNKTGLASEQLFASRSGGESASHCVVEASCSEASFCCRYVCRREVHLCVAWADQCGLQRAWRSRARSRNDVLRTKLSTAVQKRARGWLVRRKNEKVCSLCCAAVILIFDSSLMQPQRCVFSAAMQRIQDIVRIQRLLRGFQCRAALGTMHEAAVMIQKNWRTAAHAARYRRLRAAVAVIVRWRWAQLPRNTVPFTRRHLALLRALGGGWAERRRQRVRKKAALMIQRTVRLFLAKCAAARRQRAARFIQGWWSTCLTVGVHQRAAVRIQGAWKRVLSAGRMRRVWMAARTIGVSRCSIVTTLTASGDSRTGHFFPLWRTESYIRSLRADADAPAT